MGYTTDFTGEFTVTPALDPAQVVYLQAFNATRRMKRDAAKTALIPDPKREAVRLPVGDEGEYFVGSTADFGQDRTADILDYNSPPADQPGLWCQWTPDDTGTMIAWDGGEKFYDYDEWLVYIVDNFLKPWGRVLNGDVEWIGEDSDDRGMLRVRDNVVKTVRAVISYPEN